MNKFKKFMVGLIAAAGLGCLVGAAACAKAPKYYQLTFDGKGIDFVLDGALAEPDGNGEQFISGNTVKEGVEVRFSLSVGSNTVGTPTIKYNGNTLTPDANGIYSFIMSGNTTVSVEGLGTLYNLTLGKFERKYDSETDEYINEEMRVKYYDLNDNELPEEVKVESGKEFSFKLVESPYYKPDFTVRVGTEILDPVSKDSAGHGIYTVSNLTEDVIVSVAGLEQPTPFPNRPGCGTGTLNDPYLIEQPIDLYYMAALINLEMYSATFYNKHYKLNADIDMKGEQLFVIGDTSYTTAVFCGSFDGAGHKIHNFYITDELIDQTNYTQGYLPYVGMFGQAMATADNPVVIKDLTLEDYEVRVHPAQAKSSSFVGSLLGFGIGAQISGCSASNGKVTAVGDNEQMVYMGGLVGILQSAYLSDFSGVTTHDAFVRASSVDLELQCVRAPRSSGGIVGYLVTADTKAIAYIANCYSEGLIEGSMHSGGIVGTLGRYSSVSTCYSTAEVIANNELNLGGLADEYKGAYAGGIVGFAEEDSVIAACVSANEYISAYSVNAETNSATGEVKFQSKGDFIGSSAEAGASAISSSAAIVLNNNKKYGANAFTEAGWLAQEWTFSESGMPKIKKDGGRHDITVQVYDVSNGADGAQLYNSYVKNVESACVSLDIWLVRGNDVCTPVYGWFKEGTLPEYIDKSDSVHSYGYYFDANLKQRVPFGYVPTSDVKLYVGFADYSEVAGTYYVDTTTHSNVANFELTEDGRVNFRNGGMSYVSTFEYDGEKITLIDNCFASLLYSVQEINGSYFTLEGTVTDGVITLNGIANLVDLSSGSNGSFVTRNMQFTARKATATYYGTYGGDNKTYIFNRDGSGIYIDDEGARSTFTYTVNGNLANIVHSNGIWTGVIADGVFSTVNDVTVTRKNEFAGTWKKTSVSAETFEFNGYSQVSYKKVTATGTVTDSSTYSVSAGKATFTVNGTSYTAEFKNNYLDINGVTFYPDDGFTGSWYMASEGVTAVKERVDITLEGQNSANHGNATISYSGGEIATIKGQYDVSYVGGTTILRVYFDDMPYGELVYNSETKVATGAFWSYNSQLYYEDARFCKYDSFKGTWLASSVFDSVTFTGKTASGSTGVTVMSGGRMRSGTYSAADDAINGEMTVNGNTYSLVYDEFTDLITFKLKSGGTESVLARRDSLYNVTLYDGTTSYAFDGRGYIGGKVTVTTESEIQPSTLDYSVAADGTVTVDGKPFTTAAQGFAWDGKTLTFKSGFAGEWLVERTLKTLTVSEVGTDFTATVSYEGASGEYTFVYDPTAKALTYTGADGRLIATFKLSGDSVMTVVRGSSEDFISCLKASLKDDFFGVYTDSDGSKWTFDGLGVEGVCVGTAVFEPANGGRVEYEYTVNSLGMPFIEGAGKVFTPAEEGGFVKDGNHYVLITPDVLYKQRVYVGDSTDREWYVFDGVGKLWKETAEGGLTAAYDYEVIDSNIVELTAGNRKYSGRLADVGAYKSLTIEEI